jgi:hypothetical protein
MKNQKTLVVFVAILIIIATLVGVSYPKTPADISVDRIVSEVKSKLNLGALTSPDIQSSYLSVNGSRTWYNRVPVRTASSTLCTIKSPAATSTIAHASVALTTTASYVTQYLLGHDNTGNNATTTSLGSIMAVAANAKLVYVASSTVNDLFTGITNYGSVPPNSFVNFNLSTSTTGASATYAPAGYCHVDFREL